MEKRKQIEAFITLFIVAHALAVGAFLISINEDERQRVRSINYKHDQEALISYERGMGIGRASCGCMDMVEKSPK